MSLCIIPARGGSKRIPRKNIALFHGRPMIGWSIATALATGVFDRVVVSTDDHEIAEVARAEGAEVPFLRPTELAGDLTPTAPVIAHAVTALKIEPHIAVCCLYATAPMLQPADLRAGLERLQRGDASFVISVTTFAIWSWRSLAFAADSGFRL